MSNTLASAEPNPHLGGSSDLISENRPGRDSSLAEASAGPTACRDYEISFLNKAFSEGEITVTLQDRSHLLLWCERTFSDSGIVAKINRLTLDNRQAAEVALGRALGDINGWENAARVFVRYYNILASAASDIPQCDADCSYHSSEMVETLYKRQLIRRIPGALTKDDRSSTNVAVHTLHDSVPENWIRPLIEPLLKEFDQVGLMRILRAKSGLTKVVLLNAGEANQDKFSGLARSISDVIGGIVDLQIISCEPSQAEKIGAMLTSSFPLMKDEALSNVYRMEIGSSEVSITVAKSDQFLSVMNGSVALWKTTAGFRNLNVIEGKGPTHIKADTSGGGVFIRKELLRTYNPYLAR